MSTFEILSFSEEFSVLSLLWNQKNPRVSLCTKSKTMLWLEVTIYYLLHLYWWKRNIVWLKRLEIQELSSKILISRSYFKGCLVDNWPFTNLMFLLLSLCRAPQGGVVSRFPVKKLATFQKSREKFSIFPILHFLPSHPVLHWGPSLKHWLSGSFLKNCTGTW